MPSSNRIDRKVRADAALATRAVSTRAFLPRSCRLLMILPVVRNLPHLDLAPLVGVLVRSSPTERLEAMWGAHL
jgi:hypothetical protein